MSKKKTTPTTVSEPTKGILIIAFGDRGYHYAAYNLCQSIKHKNRNIKVAIYHEGNHCDFKQCYADIVKPFTADFEPGFNKITMLSDLPFDHTLYIDADSICMKDPESLLNDMIRADKFFMCEIIGRGAYGTEIQYDLWAKHEDSFDFFNVPKTNNWCTTQTSWMFARKGKELMAFVSELKHFWLKNFPKEKLKSRWGKYMPDELFFSGVLSRNNYDAMYRGEPMFFGVNYSKAENLGQIERDHYFMSLHGNGTGTTLTKLVYWEYYDRLMNKINIEMGQKYIYKKHFLMNAKITNRI